LDTRVRWTGTALLVRRHTGAFPRDIRLTGLEREGWFEIEIEWIVGVWIVVVLVVSGVQKVGELRGSRLFCRTNGSDQGQTDE
jgi:hypothetical protein